MPTLEENVNRVKAAKTAIGNAITAKGGTVGANDGLEDFAADIATIPSGGGDYNAKVIKTSQNGFLLADALTEINIPTGYTSIGTQAFQYFSGLEKINFPEGITSIGLRAFQNCSSLKNIILPTTLSSISGYAFSGCTSMETIKFQSINPPTSASSTWNSLPTTCIIYVPTGSLAAYTSAENYPDSNTYTYEEY